MIASRTIPKQVLSKHVFYKTFATVRSIVQDGLHPHHTVLHDSYCSVLETRSIILSRMVMLFRQS